ncbi:MAG: acyl-CoA thioesterase [Proteobacteria bacterium]|nr:acyl-CoA thioesterase [Pseudomonadota bacterium]
MPKDTNWLGDIFGGWLMSHADIAGGNQAYQRAGGNVVTIAVADFEFIQPVYVGDVVTFYCRICKTGTTSITIGIEAWVLRRYATKDRIKVTEGIFTFVALDDKGKKRPVPPE